MTFDHILFATDLSEQSLGLFGRLTGEPWLEGKEVTIIHVLREGGSLTPEGREALDGMRNHLAGTGTSVREVIASGDPAHEILRAERREGADLIALAASGKGRAREMFVGSTSMRVVRSSDQPVLLGKSLGSGPLLRKALVPLDLSPRSMVIERVLPALIGMGLEQAILLHVVPSTHFSADDEERFAEVADLLNHHMGGLAGKGCDIDTHVHFGTISYNILGAVRELDPSIVVMDVRRRTLLRELALGGNAEDVIRRSAASLLVVPYDD